MEERKSNTGLAVLITVLVIAVLGLTGFIVYDKVLKNAKVESNSTENSVNNADNQDKVNEPKEYEVTLSKEQTSDLENIATYLSLSTYEVKPNAETDYNKEYMDDDNFKLFFTWQQAISKLKYDEINLDGLEETGVVRFNYNDFFKYYKTIMQSDFDINRLTKKPNIYFSFPTIKNEYIYGSRITGMDVDDIKYRVDKLLSDGKTYTAIFEYGQGGFDENNNSEFWNKLATAYLKYELDDKGNKVYKSFVVKK